jgi:flagellar hook-associated protein 1 FlgK
MMSIAAQALKAQQAAIQTAGHNVANASTPGYSRQKVILETQTPAFENGLVLGRGVNATVVRSVVDQFSERWLLDIGGSLGFSTAQQSALSAIQEAFPTTGGIDSALNDFFSSLSDLSNNPSGSAERIALIGKANTLGASFQRTRSVLSSIQTNSDQDLQSIAHQVNTLTQEIAALNQRVAFSQSSNQPDNDARDQRQVRLNDLVRLTGATVSEGNGGVVNVTVQGAALVSGNRAAKLDTALGANGLHQVTIETPDGIRFDGTKSFANGELGGVLKSRDQVVPDLLNQLDTLAKALVDEVNNQHAAGFDYNGNAGGNFFQPIATVSGAAATMKVDNAIVADPNLIAAAQNAAGAPGDKRNALALVNLRNASITAFGNDTAENYLTAALGNIGEAAKTIQSSVDFQTGLQSQVQARRDETSNVSIDEEMTNLILFQRAFDASARMITTADELYQSLIDIMR